MSVIGLRSGLECAGIFVGCVRGSQRFALRVFWSLGQVQTRGRLRVIESNGLQFACLRITTALPVNARSAIEAILCWLTSSGVASRNSKNATEHAS